MFFILKFPVHTIPMWQFSLSPTINYNLFIHIHNLTMTVVKINNFLSVMLNYKLKIYKTINNKFSKSIYLIQKSNKKQREQKGTGKSRVGSLKSSMHKGGGVIFGPTPHFVSLKINIKEWVCIYKSFLINKRSNTFWVFINKNLKYYKNEKFIRNFIFHLGISPTEKIIFSTTNKHYLYKNYFTENIKLYTIKLLNFLNSKYIIYLI